MFGLPDSTKSINFFVTHLEKPQPFFNGSAMKRGGGAVKGIAIKKKITFWGLFLFAI